MTDQSEQRPASTPPGGPAVDESPELTEDDFGLNGDLADTIARGLEERWKNQQSLAPNSTDDTTSPDGTADGASQPDPTTSAPAATEPPQGQAADDAGGAGVGGDAPEGAAPDGAPPGTAPAAGQDDFSLDQYAADYFGTRLTAEQSRELFGIFGGLSALTPEKRAILDAMLAGGPVPSEFVQGGQQQAPASIIQPPAQPQYTAPPTQNAPGYPSRPGDDDPDGQHYYDQFIAPLAATQAQLQQQLQHTTQQQLAQQQQVAAAEIGRAADAWRTSHADLSDAEFARVEDNLIRAGILPNLLNVHGSYTAATTAALEQMFWADPQLREKAIANISSGRLPGNGASTDPASSITQQQQEADRARAGLASSVSGGGGGNVTREPTIGVPKTKAERDVALRQELEVAFANPQ